MNYFSESGQERGAPEAQGETKVDRRAEGGGRGQASESRTGERRERKRIAGETGQERCETALPQNCEANAQVWMKNTQEQ